MDKRRPLDVERHRVPATEAVLLAIVYGLSVAIVIGLIMLVW